MPAGPVPVPRRKAGKEMGRDVTRKRREKRSDDKSDETRPITSLSPRPADPRSPSVHSLRSLTSVPFFLGSLSRRSFLRYSHSLHAVGGSEARSGERFTVRRERRNRGP